MASDPIKCLAAAHLPLTWSRKDDADWFERVQKLASDVREVEAAAAQAATVAVVERLRKLADEWDHACMATFQCAGALRNALSAIEAEAKAGG
jgi:hypothetical protein